MAQFDSIILVTPFLENLLKLMRIPNIKYFFLGIYEKKQKISLITPTSYVSDL